jgi:hypothetical protein
MGRNLVDVIDQMIAVIPETEKQLRGRLESLKTTCVYSSPEQDSARWSHCAEILMGEIGEPVTEWQKKVAEIFSGNCADCSRSNACANKR